MQISQHVRVRGARWRVADVRPFDDCQLVTLVGLTPPEVGVERRVLTPFDVVEPIERHPRPRIVGSRRWRRGCRAAIAADTPPGSLRCPRRARLDVMPHQLGPALAIVRGFGSRVLLADAVGLGKTIQAGLIVAELLERGWIERVLVVTPAGLRDQWIAELGDRFGIRAVGTDGPSLRQRAGELPLGVNPWTTVAVAVASVDYIKRAEVLPAVASAFWDVIVVDEAHGCVCSSDRHRALDLLASRAPYVLLLTATPHSGDRRAFESLCSIGAPDAGPLLVFRRTRQDVGLENRRRVHALRTTLSPAERQMHVTLATYASAVRAERADASLALSVLHKRAFSAAWSLLQSVERRLISLSDPEAAGEQLALPFSDLSGEHVADDEPPAWPADLALADRGRERTLLTAVADAARFASRREAKLGVLVRLLRRLNEPAVVFTEYRDTLLHVQRALGGLPVVALHGGMSREERTASLAAFARGPRTVLLATDAAGEGLNLHAACRVVINLELPWNPMRLEQRIGRVDRIGQNRRVHAWHLIAAGTGEMRMLERLKSRLASARADIGAPDPLGMLEPAGDDVDSPLIQTPSTPAHPESFDAPLILSLSKDARLARDVLVETGRLLLSREVWLDPRSAPLKEAPYDGPALAPLETGPLILRAKRGRLRHRLGSRWLFLWRAICEDACGRVVESRLVPLVVDAASGARLEDLTRVLSPHIDDITASWRAEVARIAGAFAAARQVREHAIAVRWHHLDGLECQRGLFDRRADRTWEHDRETAAEAEHRARTRAATLDLRTALTFRAPELLLAIAPRDVRVHR